MTQQTLDDWLAAGNRITVCPAVPHLSFVRILSILGEDAPAPQPERLCLLRQCVLSRSWSDIEASTRNSLAPTTAWQLRTEPFRRLTKFLEIPC